MGRCIEGMCEMVKIEVKGECVRGKCVGCKDEEVMVCDVVVLEEGSYSLVRGEVMKWCVGCVYSYSCLENVMVLCDWRDGDAIEEMLKKGGE